MEYNRRLFLKSAGFSVFGAAALKLTGCNQTTTGGSDSDSSGVAETATTFKIDNFGVQLYSVRDIIEKDPKGVIKQLADAGYKKVEGYAGPGGMFWGQKPKEYKDYVSSLGMTAVSTHADTSKDLEKTAAEAAEAGFTYLLQPYIGPQKTLDEWKKRAEEFNKRGEICNAAGVKFGYHNHDYSFKEIEGSIPQEVLLANTDPSLVLFELDLFWIYVAGVDPIEHMKKYNGRYKLCHVKDGKRAPKVEQTNLGKGEIDYSKILKAAKEYGMEEFIVEQEQYPGPVMESMIADAEYMKNLVL